MYQKHLLRTTSTPTRHIYFCTVFSTMSTFDNDEDDDANIPWHLHEYSISDDEFGVKDTTDNNNRNRRKRIEIDDDDDKKTLDPYIRNVYFHVCGLTSALEKALEASPGDQSIKTTKRVELLSELQSAWERFIGYRLVYRVAFEDVKSDITVEEIRAYEEKICDSISSYFHRHPAELDIDLTGIMTDDLWKIILGIYAVDRVKSSSAYPEETLALTGLVSERFARMSAGAIHNVSKESGEIDFLRIVGRMVGFVGHMGFSMLDRKSNSKDPGNPEYCSKIQVRSFPSRVGIPYTDNKYIDAILTQMARNWTPEALNDAMYPDNWPSCFYEVRISADIKRTIKGTPLGKLMKKGLPTANFMIMNKIKPKETVESLDRYMTERSVPDLEWDISHRHLNFPLTNSAAREEAISKGITDEDYWSNKHKLFYGKTLSELNTIIDTKPQRPFAHFDVEVDENFKIPNDGIVFTDRHFFKFLRLVHEAKIVQDMKIMLHPRISDIWYSTNEIEILDENADQLFNQDIEVSEFFFETQEGASATINTVLWRCATTQPDTGILFSSSSPHYYVPREDAEALHYRYREGPLITPNDFMPFYLTGKIRPTMKPMTKTWRIMADYLQDIPPDHYQGE
jgi:hypothetical protein